MRARLGCIALVLIMGGAGTAVGESLGKAFGSEILPQWQFDQARQYDFWLGEWNANWRSLEKNNVFFEKEGRQAYHWLYPILDGKAMIELVRGLEPGETGYRTRGFSIRYYDPDKDRWVMAQNWPGPNASSGFMDQLQGFAHHGRIEVYNTYLRAGDDSKVTRRYAFSDISKASFRWDDLYTGDGGQSWRRGSVVDFSRERETATWPSVGQPMPGFDDGSHCTMEAFRRFHFLEGNWTGTLERNGATSPARFTATRIEDGCAVMSVLAYQRNGGLYRLFEARTYGPTSEAFFVYRLDNRKGTAHDYQVGRFEDSGDLVLATNSALVIRDEMVVIDSEPLIPEHPLERTVWTRIEDGAIAFEFQSRRVAGDPWLTTESFVLEKEL